MNLGNTNTCTRTYTQRDTHRQCMQKGMDYSVLWKNETYWKYYEEKKWMHMSLLYAFWQAYNLGKGECVIS